ncbi:hypothetical protein JCM10213_008985 [Rhodosporidiobolus nylandii]
MSSFKLAVAAALPLLAAAGKANTFAIVGETGASAQQAFLGAPDMVYIIDKTENNTARVNGHAAWATAYNLTTNTYTALDIETNTFCAGGNVLGSGQWMNMGGNGGVTTGGVAEWQAGVANGGGAYKDSDGGRAARWITPWTPKKGANGSATWSEDEDEMPYPTLETLADGTILVIGGEMYGGFVNSVSQMQNVPTYEYYPSRGKPVNSTFLADTQPANLYPLTWLLPNGLIFVQADWQTTNIDLETGVETRLPNVTHAQRTYPASGGTTMMPLKASDNYTATILMCGGMDPVRDDWNQTLWTIPETPTSKSCVSIQPEAASPEWVDEDDLPEGRGMGNLILLPDQRIFLSNGVAKGSAGYGWEYPNIANQSYAQDPVLRPAYYNASAPAGSRWDSNLPESTIGRLYHSASLLLPDGSVFIAGSNPNADVITEENNSTYLYKTEYRAEIFYPDYYDAPRPEPSGIPSYISYGGDSFDIELPQSSLNGTSLDNVNVVIIRTGFSTHAMQMGQRLVKLETSYTGNKDGSATIHTAQLPPNPNLLAPGPAMLFVVVDGVPSVGEFVMVGSGKVGTQPTSKASVLPSSSDSRSDASSATTAAESSSAKKNSAATSGASSTGVTHAGLAAAALAGLLALAVSA